MALTLCAGLWWPTNARAESSGGGNNANSPIIAFAGHEHGSHDHHHHHDHKHELSIAPGLSYVSHDNGFFPSLHLEYAYGFQLGRLNLSAGTYGEVIFTNHRHYSVGLTLGWVPIPRVHLHAGPGVTFDHGDVFLKGSVAAAYEFHLDRFIFGPLAEYAFHKGDYHATMGVFFGIAF